MPTLCLQQKFYSVLWDPVWLPSVRGSLGEVAGFFSSSGEISQDFAVVYGQSGGTQCLPVPSAEIFFKVNMQFFGAFLMVRVFKNLFKALLFIVCI